MKTLVKSYVIEVYEVDNTIVLDKNEIKENLANIITKNKIETSMGVFSKKQIDKILNKRYNEIEDYFRGRLPHNKEK